MEIAFFGVFDVEGAAAISCELDSKRPGWNRFVYAICDDKPHLDVTRVGWTRYQPFTGALLRREWSRVATWRDRDVPAKWSRHPRLKRPYLCVQTSHNPGQWFVLEASTLDLIVQRVDCGDTLKEAVDSTLALAGLFSLPAGGGA